MAANEEGSATFAMRELFFSQHATDVTFLVHGRIVEAHKIIVISRSPVLRAMIEGPMAPPDQRHEINDPEITFENFESFLCFLYTDQVDINHLNFKTFLHLANFYDVPYLQRKLVENVEMFLDPHTLFQYAELGVRYPGASEILEKCFHSLVMHGWDLPLAYLDAGETHKWISSELALKFVQECPRDERSFTEDAIFQKAFEWARNQNEVSNSENIRANLAPVMPHFNHEAFLPVTLATTIKDFKLLPDETLTDCLAGHVMRAVDENGNISRNRRNSDRNAFDFRGRGGFVRGGRGRGGETEGMRGRGRWERADIHVRGRGAHAGRYSPSWM